MSLPRNEVSALCHELRTPLEAIRGMADLLLSARLSDDERGLAATILVNSESVLAFLDDALEEGGPGSDPERRRSEPFAPVDVAESVGRALAHAAHTRDVELTVTVAADVPDAVQGDAHRLRQILTNLTARAVTLNRNGFVHLAVQVAAADADSVSLRFGIEMSPAGPGAQGGDHARGSSPVLGIARDLVERLGGSLDVEDVPGAGTRTNVHLRFAGTDHRFPANRASDRQYPDAVGVVIGASRHLAASVGATLRSLGAEARILNGPDGLAVALETIPGRDPVLVMADASVGIEGIQWLAARVAAERGTGRPARLEVLLRAGSDDAAFGGVPSLRIPLGRRELATALLRAGAVPVRPVRLDATDDHGDATPGDEGAHILVVEDEPANRRLVELTLARAGYRVAVAADGQEALDAMAKSCPDLLFVDMGLPDMSGSDVIRRLQELPGGQDVPVVILSGLAYGEVVDELDGVPYTAVTSKPFDAGELRALTQTLLEADQPLGV